MKCTTCGAANRAGRRFCAECAAPLAVICAGCRSANEPGEKFCGECAAPLSNAPAPAGHAADRVDPVAERRLVSVLFADLVGFTTLAEGRDAEETRELLTRYFALCRDAIERHGGTVEKFIGDAVMAVWGAPFAREDDAERAVRAALELVDAVQAMESGLDARAGVLTGEAAVTLGATDQGMVAGDLVNTASRLQAAAAPGTVLVGEATQRAASAAIVFEPVDDQTLKGKASAVPAWRALRVVAGGGGRGRTDTLEPPFVGRDDDLRLVKDLYHQTEREGRARLVSVTGTAGIGKSRLAWEFFKYLDGVVGTAWWHRGRSPAYGEGLTFWALGEMIRGRAGLAETDDEATTRVRIAEMLDEHVPDTDERRWIEQALLVLLGVESGIGSEQLFGAWRAFFERLAATRPTVLVFEDLHWADSGTLDFIEHLLEWSRALPLYIVALARPELHDRRPGWGARQRSFTSIHLDPLAPSGMCDLLDGLVPGLPATTQTSIVERADGIPLYAVEMVRMLVARGEVLLREDGVHEPLGELSTISVPESLHALIAARLDSLDADERAIVFDAAVLGQSFTVVGLAAVAGRDAGDVEKRLRALVRRELFDHETDPTRPERGQFSFVQGLIKEVAYNTLARSDRKARHLAAARHLESLESEEVAGALAGHYVAAHANAGEGPEADALAAQARIALSAAAERATSLGAYGHAVDYLRQAINVATAEDAAALNERAAVLANTAAQHQIATDFARSAVRLRRQLGERPAIARALALVGHSLLRGYQSQEALTLLEAAAEEFADLKDDPSALSLGAGLVMGYVLAERPDDAVVTAERWLPVAERLGDRVALIDMLRLKSRALAGATRWLEANALIRGTVELAMRDEMTEEALACKGHVALLESVHSPADATVIDRERIEEARRLGLRQVMINGVGNYADCAIPVGDWDGALSEVESMLDSVLERTDRYWLLGFSLAINALRGETDVARLAEFRELTATESDRVNLMGIHDTLGWIALAEMRFKDAARSGVASAQAVKWNAGTGLAAAGRAAILARDPVGARKHLADLERRTSAGGVNQAGVDVLRAGIAGLEGRNDQALVLFRDVLVDLRDLRLRWLEALAGLQMATVLDPRDPVVAQVVESTRTILIELGATPFVALLDRLVDAEAAPNPGVVNPSPASC